MFSVLAIIVSTALWYVIVCDTLLEEVMERNGVVADKVIDSVPTQFGTLGLILLISH